MAVLVLVDHDGATVSQPTRSTVAAASKLGEVHALVLGSGAAAAAESERLCGGEARAGRQRMGQGQGQRADRERTAQMVGLGRTWSSCGKTSDDEADDASVATLPPLLPTE